MELFKVFNRKKVFITGHTGFKGSWLSLWLKRLGAQITGIALDPRTPLDAFYAMNISSLCNDLRLDINDFKGVIDVFQKAQPEIVFHLAAQSLVLESYNDPIKTFNTNIIGMANILEACRLTPSVKAIIIVTSDKVYYNKEWIYGYRENDRLGGKDPYSSSKACAELIVHSYRESFFKENKSCALATVRAGNVIGGGDWAKNRIVPDSIRSLSLGEKIEIRNPQSVRPWQQVLEPLRGYLLLAENMLEDPIKFSEAWNFGPGNEGIKTVRGIAEELIKHWGCGNWVNSNNKREFNEAGLLILDISKARNELGWDPVLNFEEAISMTVEWYKAQANQQDMQKFSYDQIKQYEAKLNLKST